MGRAVGRVRWGVDGGGVHVDFVDGVVHVDMDVDVDVDVDEGVGEDGADEAADEHEELEVVEELRRIVVVVGRGGWSMRWT